MRDKNLCLEVYSLYLIWIIYEKLLNDDQGIVIKNSEIKMKKKNTSKNNW